MCFWFGRVWSPVDPCWVMCFVFYRHLFNWAPSCHRWQTVLVPPEALSRLHRVILRKPGRFCQMTIFCRTRQFLSKPTIFFLDETSGWGCSPRDMSWEVGNFWPQLEDPRSGMSFEETPESPIYLRSQEGVMKANNRKVIWYIPQKWNLIYEASFDQHVWKPRDENKFWASTRLPPWLTWSSSSWHPDPPGRWPRPTYITPPPTSPAVPYMM